MAVTVYRSTDPSAPVLAGQAGALIGVLDAVLVNGYGSKTALGWTKEFSGTNLASYRPGSGQGNRLYLGVDDTATQAARVRGFQSMTAAGVAAAAGTNPFPTDAQLSGGLYVYKSSAASSAARSWIIVSDGNIFYMFIDTAADGLTGGIWCFGTFVSYKSGDANCTILIANSAGNNTTNTFTLFGNVNATQAAKYLSQKYDGITYSVPAGTVPIFGAHFGFTVMGAGAMLQYPDPLQGGMLFTPVYIVELSGSSGVLRGRLPGIWAPCHTTPFMLGDVIVGTAGDLNGKILESFRTVQNTTQANPFIETSDTWNAINFR